MSLIQGANEAAVDLFVARQAGPIPFDDVERTLGAYREAFERILGAPAGSLRWLRRGHPPPVVRLTRQTGKERHDRHHRDREAHQVLRLPPRDRRRRPRGRRRARCSASSARTAPARRRRSGRCSTTSGRRAAGPRSSASRRPSTRSRSIAGSATSRASSRLYDRLTGGQTLALLREPAGRRRHGLPGLAHRALRHRPVAPVQGVLEGQQAEDRPRHRPPAPARAADPRRADLGARPARPADRSTRSSARRRPRAGRSSCRATSSARSSGPATGWRSSARAGSSRSTGSRRCATSPTTRSSCGSPGRSRPRSSRRCPGVSDVAAEDHRLRMRVSGSIAPVVQAAARYELRRLRQPRADARGDVPRPVRPRGASRWPTMTAELGRVPPSAGLTPVSTWSRIYGLGSVYAKTLRDSRLAVHHRGRPARRVHARRRRGHPQRLLDAGSPRRDRRAWRTSSAARPQGLAGNPVNVGTLGGYIQWKYGPVFLLDRRPLVDPRPVRHARERGAPRQPRVRRRHPVREAPHRAREARRPPDGDGRSSS